MKHNTGQIKRMWSKKLAKEEEKMEREKRKREKKKIGAEKRIRKSKVQVCWTK